MKLEDLPKKNIYQVPEAYFDKLPGIVMAQVQEKDTRMGISWLLDLWRVPYLRGALAGLALVIAFVFTFNLYKDQNAESASLLSHISDKEAIDYLIRSERLESQDLSLLSQTNTDISHEFIQVSQEDIWQEIDEEDLADYYSN